MMKITVTPLTIGSTINCPTHTNAPTRTVSTVAKSTAPIIVPFGTFMTRRMDIRDTIIRSHAITATVIGVINSVFDWSSQSGNLAMLRCSSLSYTERIWNVPEHDDDRYPC